MRSSIVAVVLAAGSGTRMGGCKALVRLGGLTLLEWTARRLREAAVFSDIQVVVGANAEEVGTECARLGLPVISNPQYGHGMMSSLQAAVEAQPEASAILFALVDQPWVKPETLRQLVEAFLTSESMTLARPVYQGFPGNPCVVGREHFEALRKHPPADRGGAFLFKSHSSQALLLPVDDASVCCDLDTPADLRTLEQSLCVS